MKRNRPALFSKLPSGLTYTKLARRFRVPYLTALRAAHKFGYAAADGRHSGQMHRRLFDPETVDWNKSNIQIARELLVSRERVRQVRNKIEMSASTRRRNFHNGKRNNNINQKHKHTK